MNLIFATLKTQKRGFNFCKLKSSKNM
eukprot:UN13871